FREKPLQKEKPLVEITTIQKTAITRTLKFNGALNAQNDVFVNAQTAGTVDRVPVQLGQYVRQGQTLVAINSAVASAQLSHAKTQYDAAKLNFERMKTLYESGSIAKAQFEQTEVQFKQAEAAYRIAQTNYNNAIIRAPFSGKVAELEVSRGDTINPGMPIVRVVNDTYVESELTAADSEIILLKKGQPCTAKIDLFPNITFHGAVKNVGTAATQENNVYPLIVKIKNKDNMIKSGMAGEIIIKLKKYEGIVVPINALITREEKQFAFVIVSENMTEMREIERVFIEDDKVFIKKGLKIGEHLITKGMANLVGGEEIIISNIATKNASR
ncbi:efflux RND transporter periplasmic adaptor subunit, partial [Candidatus Margulisiibacteriota bacterium]